MRISLAAVLAACLSIGLAPGFAPRPAQAEGRSIIVLDGSGSMWGQIDGRPKLEIAREALATVLAGLPAETEIGLMAYGHRSKGDCGDIELIVPPAQGTARAITDAANAMKFLGKTPLTDAVRQAAADLRSTEEKATVILITDGIETCAADPCALGTELERSGVDFTAHVVGFGLSKEEGQAVACLAENTGGRYIAAADAGALVQALETAVAAVPEPAPEEPAPAPAEIENNVDPAVLLVAGGPEPEEAQDAYFEFTPLGPDGQPAGDSQTIYGTSRGSLPAGRYLMKTTLHQVVVAQEVEVTGTEVARPVAVLDAGIFEVTVTGTEGAEPDANAYWELRGPDGFVEYSFATGHRVVPAGEYAFKATLGAAELTDTVVIEAGKTTVKHVVMGVGLAVVDGFYVEGMKVEGSDLYIEIFEAKQAMDGSRKSVGYAFGPGASFDLPPGDYLALVQIGAAKVEVPFTISPGERNEVKGVLNAGVAAITLPGQEFAEILAAKADIAGNRASFGYGFGSFQTTLPAGDYVVAVDIDGKRAETPLKVTAGERSELSPALP